MYNINMYIYMYIKLNVHCIVRHECMLTYMYIIYKYVGYYIHVCISLSLSLSLSIYIKKYICIYIYIYIFIYNHSPWV